MHGDQFLLQFLVKLLVYITWPHTIVAVSICMRKLCWKKSIDRLAALNTWERSPACF